MGQGWSGNRPGLVPWVQLVHPQAKALGCSPGCSLTHRCFFLSALIIESRWDTGLVSVPCSVFSGAVKPMDCSGPLLCH